MSRSISCLATLLQVPQLKAKGLILSLVPADAGRPTVKLGKAAIIDGTCSWDNTIYETMKLERDSKAGKFQEKIYYFIVATVSTNQLHLPSLV